MKQLHKLPLAWLTVIGLSIGFTACNDDFNEEDLLQAQQDLADAANADRVEALNQAGNLLDYTVTVHSDDVPIQGASVSATNQSGATATVTTDATGNAVFSDIQLGAHTIAISSANHLNVSYLVDFGKAEEGVHYELINGNVIPKEISEASKMELYALSGIQTATIKGRVEIETDLTNSTPEVPQDITIRANLDATGFEGQHSGRERNSSGTTGSIYVTSSFSFTQGDIGSATVDNTTGEYSMVVPATDEGTDVELLYPLIETDQTLAFSEVNGEDVGLQVGTQMTRFGPDISSTATPTAPGVIAVFPAPADPGRGFSVTNFTTMPRDLNVTGGVATIDNFPIEELDGITSSRIQFRGTQGSGYQLSPTVAVDPADLTNGADAEMEAWLEWTFESVTINNEGTGYVAGENVDVIIEIVDDNSLVADTEFVGTVVAEADGTLPASLDFVDISGIDTDFIVTELNVTFVGGSGTGATGTLTRNGFVRAFRITDDGNGYTSIPAISVDGGTPSTAATLVIEEMAFQYAFDLDNSGITQGYVVLPEISFDYEDSPGSTITSSNVQVVNFDADGFINNSSSSSPLQDFLIVSGNTLEFDNDDFFGPEMIEKAFTSFYSFSVPTPIVIEPEHRQASADIVLLDGELTGLVGIDAGSGYTSEFDVTITVLTGLPGSGGVVDLTNFDTNENTGQVTWNQAFMIISSGSDYEASANIGQENFAGANSVEMRNGETMIINVNYGTGDTVEDVN